MAAHRPSFLWALLTVLCAAALLVTPAAGRLAAEAQDSQPPPPPLVPAPKEKSPSLRTEGSGGSTSAPPSGGAGAVTPITPQNISSTNHSQLNQPPQSTPPLDPPPQSSPPLPRTVPGKLPKTPKNPTPPLLSPPPPSVPEPPVPVSASPPPTGKQKQAPTGIPKEDTPTGTTGSADGSGDGSDKKKGDGSHGWKTVGHDKVDKCGGIHFKCTFPLAGCIISSQNGNGGYLLYVRNIGDKSMNMTIFAPSQNFIEGLPKNGTGQILVSIDKEDLSKIIIKTGGKTCIPSSKDTFTSGLFKQFQFYTARMTPIYGAYAFFVMALTVGGACVCCSFVRKGRRRDSGVPYQQLEMGGIQSHTTDVADNMVGDTADGWEQGWDDDWDDEEAVSRPHDSENPPTNGTTSKSTKDGWEDWDD